MSSNSKQNLTTILAVVIVALLGINGYLMYNSSNKTAKIEAQEKVLVETQNLADSLDTEYNMAIAELDQMKGTNTELNEIIENQKTELGAQKSKISKLIRNGKDLKRAREEMKNMTAQIEQYVAEIGQLRGENEKLLGENTTLTTNLMAQKQQNEELETAKSALVSEKNQLENQRQELSEKVNFASVVKVGTVEVTGFKERSNGKLISKKYAKNIQKLQVCFNTTENKLAQPGTEKFYVRLINPTGETLAIDELGSGIMNSQEAGGEVRYTKTVDHDYNNDVKNVCFMWQPNVAFQKGNYEVEVYNKGYLAGKGGFRLK